jgi:hypothetical protein
MPAAAAAAVSVRHSAALKTNTEGVVVARARGRPVSAWTPRDRAVDRAAASDVSAADAVADVEPDARA